MPDVIPMLSYEDCASAASWLVDAFGFEAHLERASAAGARMLSALEDTPHGRRCRVEDLEGHRWVFEERARPALHLR